MRKKPMDYVHVDLFRSDQLLEYKHWFYSNHIRNIVKHHLILVIINKKESTDTNKENKRKI
jgi:hypothetical protein